MPDPEMVKAYYQHEAQQRQAAQAAAAEEEARRINALREQRQARQLREAYASLSTEERLEFDRLTDQRALVERLTEQARAEADREFTEGSRADSAREFADWRSAHPRASQWELHTAQQQIKANEHRRAQEWQSERERLALEAEAAADPIDRLLMTLSPKERAVFTRLLKEQPSLMEKIGGVKMTAEQRRREELQVSLRPRYEAELAQASTPSWKHNVRSKYRALGLLEV